MNNESKNVTSIRYVYKDLLSKMILNGKKDFLEMYNATNHAKVEDIDALRIDGLEFTIISIVIREYIEKIDNVEEAVNMALDYCIAHGFLRNLLSIDQSIGDGLRGENEDIDRKRINSLLYDECYEEFYEKWKEEGRKMGIMEGHQEGIIALIRCCKDLEISNNRTLKELNKLFGLQKSEAVIYMKEYWEQ